LTTQRASTRHSGGIWSCARNTTARGEAGRGGRPNWRNCTRGSTNTETSRFATGSSGSIFSPSDELVAQARKPHGCQRMSGKAGHVGHRETDAVEIALGGYAGNRTGIGRGVEDAVAIAKDLSRAVLARDADDTGQIAGQHPRGADQYGPELEDRLKAIAVRG